MDVGGTFGDFSVSDHHTIHFKINTEHRNIPLDNRVSKMCFKFEEANLTELSLACYILDKQISASINKKESLNSVWTNFKNKFKAIANDNIPNYTAPTRKKHWYTRDTIRQIRRKRRRMKKNLRTHNDSYNIAKLEKQNQLCKKLTNSDYNEYINKHVCDKLAEGNTKPLYKFIANKRSLNNTIKSYQWCLE